MKEKVNDWLAFAENDLLAANELVKIDERLSGVVAYHAQQVVEKSLKAYLIFYDQEIMKTHDLQLLLQRCMIFDPELFAFRNHVKILNPFSSKTRYPDDQFVGLSQVEAEELVKFANECFKFVSDRVV
jgi:HEPN domain-containing protein